MTKQRRTFTPEFKREAASVVLGRGYSHRGSPVAWGGRVCKGHLVRDQLSTTERLADAMGCGST
jgi:transposase-like protein